MPVKKNKNQTILDAAVGWKKISGGKHRGVFALRDIKKGEVIETAPVIALDRKNIRENGEAPDGYILQWNDRKRGEEYCMPLGYIMLYNHSGRPNMAIDSDLKNYTMTAKALRNIEAGEELTWDYACELWFDEV